MCFMNISLHSLFPVRRTLVRLAGHYYMAENHRQRNEPTVRNGLSRDDRSDEWKLG